MARAGLFRRALVLWLVLLAVMFTNGIARGIFLQPTLGEHRARQISSLAGVLLVLTLSRAFVWRSRPHPPSAWLQVGLLWLILTVAFEFLFGRFISGLSWDVLLSDYDVTRGRLWPLVLAATVVGPWWFGVRHWRARTRTLDE